MGLRDQRPMNSFTPRRGRDHNANRRQTPMMPYGTLKFSRAYPFPIFRVPGGSVSSGGGVTGMPGVKIIRASLLVDVAVAAANESFWSFQLIILPSGSQLPVAVNKLPVTTVLAGMTANQPFDITADTGSTVNDVAGGVVNAVVPATIPTQIMKPGDVLCLQAIKTGSPAVLTNLQIYVEYEVTGLTTTTSSSTTVTTSTSVTTSSSTSTSSTTSTSSSTSTSTTTNTSTSTTITTSTSSSTSVTTSSTTSTSSSTSVTTSSTTSTSISTSSTLT